MRGQRSRRTPQAVAVFLSSLVASGSIPWTGFAAPPKPGTAQSKPAAGKKGNAKPAKSDDPKRADARKNYADAEAKFQSGDYDSAFNFHKAAHDAVPARQTLSKTTMYLDTRDVRRHAMA